ncbi:bifunctional 3-(3-hydroxy-phenyl)propionate/3-hydroxycinnamic acid hydroxylase [Celeribacter sp. ULVN23_4]
MSGEWDVAIVGCGPVGAYAANLLGRAGLKTIVLEKDTSPYALPRAVHFDHEMVRLLGDAGVLAALEDKLLAADGHLHIGADHGVIRYLSGVDQSRPFGYANDYFFYQPELEKVLRDAVASYENVTLLLGVEVNTLMEQPNAVSLGLSDGSTVSAKWVIGADGARSTIRKALGITLDDLDFEEPWLVVDAEVEGPIVFPDFAGVSPEADLQRLSVMMCDPKRPATIVPGRGKHRRWEFMLLPNEDDQIMASSDAVAQLVLPWVGSASHRIIRAATYRFHGLVAKCWRKGRVFLAGDAAHQTPPFFGQGMCHGMRDVANLAWKLDLVCKAKAPSDLLDTYQPERDPQVRHVIGKAIEAGKYICVLDPEVAAERDRRVRAQADIQTAAELIAPISSPIVGKGGGERFINPPVGDGASLFDAVTGGGWVLLTDTDLKLTDRVDVLLKSIGAKIVQVEVIGDFEGHLTSWLKERGVSAALVRPDFYVALTAKKVPDLEQALTAMTSAMGIAPAAVRA